MNLEEKVFDGNEILKNTMFENITRAFGEMRDDKEISKYIRERMEEKDPGNGMLLLVKIMQRMYLIQQIHMDILNWENIQ